MNDVDASRYVSQLDKRALMLDRSFVAGHQHPLENILYLQAGKPHIDKIDYIHYKPISFPEVNMRAIAMRMHICHNMVACP